MVSENTRFCQTQQTLQNMTGGAFPLRSQKTYKATTCSLGHYFVWFYTSLQIFFNGCEAGYPAVVREDCVTSRNSLDKLMLTHSPVERTDMRHWLTSHWAQIQLLFFQLRKISLYVLTLIKMVPFGICASPERSRVSIFPKNHYVTQKLTQPGISQVFTFFPSRDKVSYNIYIVPLV